ncbi:MAG: cation diffusion facilitator family transporter [Methanobacteriaceae archaeon]|nr:cation diffusion facilitator family transporter [Methanobacteriaceae archaeon]
MLDKNKAIKLKRGQTAAKYSSLANLILAVIKGVVGLLSGSVALIADSVHSFSDIFASFAVYLGLKLSQRKPDQKFPYGYYKIESFISLIISIIIMGTGVEIGLESYHAFLNPTTIGIPLISLLTAVISVFVSFALSVYKTRVGTEIGSKALMNDGKHSLIDVFTSIIVFFSILTSFIGYPQLQGLAGIFVAFLIIYLGLKLSKNDILVLLDACLDPEKVKKIKNLSMEVDGVENVHDIKVRRSGPFVFADLHLETLKEFTVEQASEISNNLEKQIKAEIDDLDGLNIKIEPKEKLRFRGAVPIKEDNGLNSNFSEHFGKTPYILFVDLYKGKITDFYVKENPGKRYERKKGIKAAEFLNNEKTDIVSEDVVEGPMYVLATEFVRIKSPEGKNLKEMVLNAVK